MNAIVIVPLNLTMLERPLTTIQGCSSGARMWMQHIKS